MNTITFGILWITFNFGPLGLIGVGAVIGAAVTAAFNRVAA